MKKKSNLKAIDFFCSIGGMTYGFQQAGINVLAGIDIDPSCKETYEYNNPDSKFILSDITNYSFEDLKKETGIKEKDDDLVFIGCSPCQYWTIMNTTKAKSEKSKNLLVDFQRFVEHFLPGYVVVENVPGILRKKEESGLKRFIEILKANNYIVKHDILHADKHGVPQKRKRFTLVASRVNKKIELPEPDRDNIPIVKNFIGIDNGFPSISHGHRDLTAFMHTTAKLSELNFKRIKNTRENGGSRLDWKDDPELQLECYKGNDRAFNDIYGRMKWDEPAPTITTKFHSISNGRFGHPSENRGLSLREGATLQTFPSHYSFKETSMGKVAKHIGNAVPPELAKKIAHQLLTSK